MLRGLRKASSNWVGKTIMFVVVGFLVVSFAVWGIGDIFRGFGLSTVAKIGRTEITVEQFRVIYNEKLQQITRQVGRGLTADQVISLGIDRQIVGQLVAETALDERGRQLGLNISNEEIARQIRADRNFWNISGQFDRGRFEAILRQAGFTEQRYINEQRQLRLRQQLAVTVAGSLPVPKAQIEALNRFQGEQRAIEYVLLTAADAGEIPAPTPEEVAAYFEEHKSSFRAPEYRKLTVVSVIPEEQARWIEVSEADARQAYDQRKARYVTPERRHVLQMVFPDLEAAKAASEKIVAGTPFKEVATQRGLGESDIDLGIVARTGIVDPKIAEAAFSLKQGEVSPPVEGRFGPVLVQVVAVEPEKVRSFEEASAEIKRDLQLERAKVGLTAIYEKIEEERAGGASLAEAAERLKLSARTIDAVDRSGRDPQGIEVSGFPEAARIVGLAFNADVGVENDPLQIGGGYIWYDVNEITPARDRPLDEIKDRVAAEWRDEEIAKRLQKLAGEILDKVKAGTALAEAAGARKVETAAELKRGQPAGPLSAKVVDAAFATPKDSAATAEGDRPTEHAVFRVTDVTVPAFAPDTENAKQIEQALRQSISEGVLNQYVARIERDIGTTINQAAVRQVVGGVSPDQQAN